MEKKNTQDYGLESRHDGARVREETASGIMSK